MKKLTALRTSPFQSCILACILIVACSPAAVAGEPGNIEDIDLEELLRTPLFGSHHTHRKGEWMFGYGWMSMGMAGNIDGTDSVGDARVFDEYNVSPQSMRMQMHMLHVMYAIGDGVTVMTMVPLRVLSMDNKTYLGGGFTTNTAGFSDPTLMAHLTPTPNAVTRVIFGPGLTLPVGAIEVRGDTPMGADSVLPYPMRLGTGSPGLVGLVVLEVVPSDFSWSASTSTLVPMGQNRRGYRVGPMYRAESGAHFAHLNPLAFSAGLRADHQTPYIGADPDLNPAVVPTADPALRRGTVLSVTTKWLVGFHPKGLSAVDVGVQGQFPIYQNLSGPQLKHTWGLGAVVNVTTKGKGA